MLISNLIIHVDYYWNESLELLLKLSEFFDIIKSLNTGGLTFIERFKDIPRNTLFYHTRYHEVAVDLL